jgi:hypothetical protein
MFLLACNQVLSCMIMHGWCDWHMAVPLMSAARPSWQPSSQPAASRLTLRAPAAGGVPDLLASASSDGVVKLWDARMMSSSGTCKALAQADTRARVTCMTAADPTSTTPRRPAVKAEPGSKPKQQVCVVTDLD